MYCKFFGFSEKPFDVTPDPKFLYLSRGHVEMLASLTYGIQERRGFIVIVGEVGTGKTSLLNTALDRLDPKTKVAFIFNTDVTFNQMLNMALADLGIAMPHNKLSKTEAVQRLNAFAIQQLPWGGNVALIIDEAQNLDLRSMENLRLLSNLETRKHKLVQIILSGQPELDVKLSQPELRQLTQRISLKRYILPLSETETYEYVRHRLAIANYKGPSLFTRSTEQLIWEYSGGVPRKINILCDNALLIGYALKKKKIGPSIMEEAIKDLSWSPFLRNSVATAATSEQVHVPHKEKSTPPHPWFALSAGLVMAACLIFGAWFFWGNSPPNLQRSRPISLGNLAQTAMTSQWNSSAQSFNQVARDSIAHSWMQWEGLLATVPEKTIQLETSPFADQAPDQQKSEGEKDQRNDDRSALNQLVIPTERDKDSTTQARFVVVKRGDTLEEIIKRTYEKYDEAILSNVLRENPEILSAHHIFEGQVIRLPEID